MMKKIYLGAIALIAGVNISAQTIDFESTSLATNSYNNGSDLSGGFNYNGIDFSNYYDTTYLYNEGFSISNVQDNTTSGWGNQYSAITGGGFNSANYAIFYPSGNIDLSSSPKLVHSMKVTNTTFAALSMKNGDSVGKKFGSIYDANGNIDNTNGEDFLKLIIRSMTISGDTIASLEYYLADYRFADSTQDYIIEDWDSLDLTSLNSLNQTIAYLVFEFESSDIGSFGTNTPTYFAMDDFVFTSNQVGIEENLGDNDWTIFPNPIINSIQIKGISGKASLRNMAGEVLFTAFISDESIDLSYLPSGIYTLTVSNHLGFSTKKIVKQ
jgi:hypothetical protein